MEPISYLRAPIRRWPVLIPFVLVCVVVALLLPVNTKAAFPTNTWQANAQVGLAPNAHTNKLGAKLGLKQLEYYAHIPAVIDAAARAEGVPVTKKLQNEIVISKAKASKEATAAAKASGGGGAGGKKKGSGNILQIAVLQPTKSKAVSMTNAFVGALGTYAQQQLTNQSKQAEYVNALYITNLQSALKALPTGRTTTPTTIKPGTTPTVKHHKAKRTVIRPPVTTTTHPATTTTAHALGSFTELPAQLTAFRAERPAVVTPTTLAPVQIQPSTPTSLPGTLVPGATTTTTTPGLSRQVKQERNVLTNELAHAQAKQQLLISQPTPQTGYKIINSAKGASNLHQVKTSILARHSVRLGIGFLVGLILGILATWLLDGLDRRLRTTKRAEEVFRLPVVSEIPAGSNAASAIPVVDIVVDPYSPISEAYRKLYVAIISAPAVTWVKRGGLEPAELAPARPLVATPAGAMAGNPDASPVAEGRYPVPVGTTSLVSPRRQRFAILITSPNDEPSRSLAVVNLATVFAEAGDRVLVATTGGMRTEFEGNGKGLGGWEGEMPDTDPAELVANARPSQIPGVSSLALGSVFSNPARLALKAGSLIEAARDVVDVLLIEAPLLSTQDGAALLPVVDLAVVVCESWHTTVQDGLRTQRLLTQRRPPVLGLVMTNMQKDQLSKSSR